MLKCFLLKLALISQFFSILQFFFESESLTIDHIAYIKTILGFFLFICQNYYTFQIAYYAHE